MWLLESKSSRRRRLFQDESGKLYGAIRHYLDFQPLDDLGDLLGNLAFLWTKAGADISAAVVEECVGLSKAWGRGNQRKAHALVRLFTATTVSPWLRFFLAPTFPTESRVQKQAVFEHALAWFGKPSSYELERFVNLDAQYNYDADRQERDPGVQPLPWLLLTYHLALEACGKPVGVNWSRLTFPVKDVGQVPNIPIGAYFEITDILWLTGGIREGLTSRLRKKGVWGGIGVW